MGENQLFSTIGKLILKNELRISDEENKMLF